MFTGRGDAGCCAVTLYVGEGPRGSNGTRSTLHRVSATPSASHNQIGPLWCWWFPSKWACAHSRPLWVSPTTSPVRLGASPAAAPAPTGVFSQRSEALFPCAGALGYGVCFAPCRLSQFICARVWGHGVLPASLPAPFSTTLSPALSAYLRECGAAGSASHLLVGSASCSLACPIPQSATLLDPPGAALLRVLSTPAARLRPSYQSG